MATYYHIAGKGYNEGEALYSYDRQLEMGLSPEWKWDEESEGLDTDLVCLFDSRTEAQEFADEFGGTMLAIEITDDEDRLRMVTNDEGYRAVFNAIPAELIRRI